MEIYVFDEFYEKKLSNREIAEKIIKMGYQKEQIYADSAEPKSIDELRRLGIMRIAPARKGQDSVMHGVQFCQNYKIYIHPRCVNYADEIAAYTWAEDRNGIKLNRPVDGFNHCLIAGTLITTKRGDIPIESITTDDLVLTRVGWKRVVFSGITGVNKTVYELKTSNGKSVIGTPNHYIFSNGTYKKLEDLHFGDLLLTLSEDLICEQNPQYMMVNRGAGTRNQKTDLIENILNVEIRGCTDMSGKNPMEKYQKGTTSTIKTETAKTTELKTSKWYRLLSILQNIRLKANDWKSNKNTPTKYDLSQKHGMLRKRGETGIEIMQSKVPKKWNCKNSIVKIAEKRINQNQPEPFTNTVQMHVNQNAEENRG
jgi:hypothetical protein